MSGLLTLLLYAGLFYFMMRFGCGAHMVHGHGGHEHGDQPDTAASGHTTDPVCGMPVAQDHGYTKVHEGRAYRFCSRACLDKFEADPQRYLVTTGGVR
jgi:YHS domain-containing protein